MESYFNFYFIAASCTTLLIHNTNYIRYTFYRPGLHYKTSIKMGNRISSNHNYSSRCCRHQHRSRHLNKTWNHRMRIVIVTIFYCNRFFFISSSSSFSCLALNLPFDRCQFSERTTIHRISNDRNRNELIHLFCFFSIERSSPRHLFIPFYLAELWLPHRPYALHRICATTFFLSNTLSTFCWLHCSFNHYVLLT